ncbi:MAG: hypothetical protein JWL88_700 [Parcubacteria group bacterium]|nr:hypothetical protein [Parcubacteria group bacterium]
MDTPTPAPVTNEPVAVPITETRSPEALAKERSASWGAIIIIVLILAMVIVGAFYAWGKRIAQTQPPVTSGASY